MLVSCARVSHRLKCFLSLLVAFAYSAQAFSVDEQNIPPIDNPRSLGDVARVGHSRINAEEVFELWTPVWHETQAKVRNGRMPPAEGDARLTEEWRKAITALVKDELFYQEAEREHVSFINNIVDNVMRSGSDRPRNQVANEIRRVMRQDMEKYFRQLNSEFVRESGGMLKLHKVLEGRGLTFQEWQNRLRKKAFTQSYLTQILKPRAPDPGPRQIQEYYATHDDEFRKPGLVRFRHIFFSNAVRGEEKAREDAILAWELLEDGEIDFESAAAEFSDDEVSKSRGGLETGEEAANPEREAWLADIRTSLREETPGEIGPILESPFGCHVAVLISVGPDVKAPFGEVRREIERKLHGQIWEAETDRYFLSIRKNTEIQVLMPNFPSYLSCAVQAGRGTRGPQVIRTSRPDIIDAPSPSRGRGR